MGEKLMVGFAFILTIIAIPCILTLAINGQFGADTRELTELSTGRDVLICQDGQNVLVDAEVYIAHVLPGLVAPDAALAKLEEQAMEVRTKIYQTMGQETVVEATKLGFDYYTKEDYDRKWGKGHYDEYRVLYERAVLNTKKQIFTATVSDAG